MSKARGPSGKNSFASRGVKTRLQAQLRQKVRAVKHFVRRLVSKQRPQLPGRYFTSAAWCLGNLKKPRYLEGVNLVGYIRAEMGLGEAVRGIALALEHFAEPFDVLNIPFNNPSRANDTSWQHRETEAPGFDVTIVVVNPDNLSNVMTYLRSKGVRSRYVIAYWFWELPEIPDAWLPAFELVDEVWAATRFVQDALTLKSPLPVYRVPVALRETYSAAQSRSYFSLPEAAFLFLNMSDTQSYLQRKNPTATVIAFQRAFRADDNSVGLVMKVNNPDNQRDLLTDLKRAAEPYRNIYFLEQTMSRDEVDSLVSVCNSYVSLHRSEGFGLGPAEAMHLGKPVIMTNWSGNIDYMTSVNSLPVAYNLVPIGHDCGPYEKHQVWADPDVDEAAAWMRKLVDDRLFARRVGAEAAQSIREQLSPRTVGNRIIERLRYIRRAL